MKMTKYWIYLFIIILAIVGLLNLNYIKQLHFRQPIIFYSADMQTIYEYDLSSMTKKKIYQQPCCLMPDYIGKINQEHVFVTSNDQSSKSAIFLIDIATGNKIFVTEGELAAYFPASKKIFYITKDHGVNYLYTGEYDFVNNTIIHSKKIIKILVNQTIIMLNANLFVFNDPMHSGEVYLYHYNENMLHQLPINNCQILAYRENQHALLCANDQKIFSITLDGKKIILSKQLSHFNFKLIDYLQDRDQLIFTQDSTFYSYQFNNKPIQKLYFQQKN